ncbi:MAG: hypothetical protein KGI90_07060 [Burkholderiales bacterium]|nr:hypothetical protein [Burkholderiales bacterium]
MSTSHDDLLRRAFAAYFRSAAGEGGVPLQPSKSSSVETIDGLDYVVLRNVKGPLAVYRVRNDGMLKGLKRWPAAIQ